MTKCTFFFFKLRFALVIITQLKIIITYHFIPFVYLFLERTFIKREGERETERDRDRERQREGGRERGGQRQREGRKERGEQ